MKTTNLEKVLEKRLVKEVEALHGWCLKFWCISFTGFPDRIVLIPGARIYFVEVKREGKKPNERQIWVHNKLRKFGFKVYWISTKEQLKTFLDEI